MEQVKIFTFNPFEENTILVTSKDKECIIFDPGCYTSQEEQTLVDYINKNNLKPARLINTHGHLDHVFGNHFIYTTYKLSPEIHQDELPILKAAPLISQSYGVPFPDDSPLPKHFLEEGDTVIMGNIEFQILLTPGHSPASLSFYCEKEGFLIGGDVLFRGSIGRTDLPGGDYDTLIKIVRDKIFTLPEDTIVYPGHGPSTTVGYEKKNNPFFE